MTTTTTTTIKLLLILLLILLIQVDTPDGRKEGHSDFRKLSAVPMFSLRIHSQPNLQQDYVHFRHECESELELLINKLMINSKLLNTLCNIALQS